jgi:hypothetical protein
MTERGARAGRRGAMREGGRAPATLRVHSARARLFFCIPFTVLVQYTLMRNKRKRTKPAELNTAPLPALKIGLSADTVMVHQGLALLCVDTACLP